jgi:phosphatidylglycerophosphate synthase
LSLPEAISPPADTTPTDYRRWVPNALTGSRIVIATAFFVLLSVWKYPAAQLVVSPRHPVWPYLIAAALFGLAALTDAIDGPLARRWKTVSKFGRVMDPVADKLLVIGAFIMGVMNNGMSIMGIGIDWQQVIKGAVLMLAVFLDVYYKNKG